MFPNTAVNAAGPDEAQTIDSTNVGAERFQGRRRPYESARQRQKRSHLVTRVVCETNQFE